MGSDKYIEPLCPDLGEQRMQSNYAQPLSHDTWVGLAQDPSPPDLSLQPSNVPEVEGLTYFRSHFVGAMELAADRQTVAEYLNVHQGWFCRCAHPMKVEPIGENGYLIVVGHYGSLGFEIEPKIGLRLLPPDALGVYRIETIPEATSGEQGYQVDFQAALQLVDKAVGQDGASTAQVANGTMPSAITHVEWTLDLNVSLRFPRFIQRLPQSLIQSTGDRLLGQIVRQVSKRLTLKVQEDFHATLASQQACEVNPEVS